MPLNFIVPDVKPLLNEARKNRPSSFIVGVSDLFGLERLEGIMVAGGRVTLRSGGLELNRIPIKLDGFLSQPKGFLNKKIITRRDVIVYIPIKQEGCITI